MIGDHAFHVVGEKYIAAVRRAGVLPFLILVLDPPISAAGYCRMSTFAVTGSLSNVAPHRCGGHELRNPKLLDEGRDAWTFPLMRRRGSADADVRHMPRLPEPNVALVDAASAHGRAA
jgi:gamma-glutamyl-gamma-aminobutyrate hydrolase PuuD